MHTSSIYLQCNPKQFAHTSQKPIKRTIKQTKPTISITKMNKITKIPEKKLTEMKKGEKKN